jgi:superfamily II DNA or RNA helicase/HKD family nuclease
MTLQRGLYEVLLTERLSQLLSVAELRLQPELGKLDPADAADRIALHLSRAVERAIRSLPESDRARVGARLAGNLIAQLVADTQADTLREERLHEPPQVLLAMRAVLPDGIPEPILAPLIPLLDTTLLTNSPGEPRVGHQIQTEIASADRIDVIMAFIRRSGLAQIREPLRRHLDAGRTLRVLTTTYTGSTEVAALEDLIRWGAEVRVSYDTSTTRLHAKAWLFHRDSGFSTGYVGSSNLTHSAQVDGLEWNVRVSAARNEPVIDKIAAVFESYWQQAEFEPFVRERFLDAIDADRASAPRVFLSLVEIRLEPFQERLLEQIELSRAQGWHRNLLAAATGTGKTVMAAVDYARLRERLPRARLLFVAHREEILAQSQATFAHAIRDASFGELWVGGSRPRRFEHVFASIQSLNAAGFENLAPDHFDVVIIDEFHHAAAASYQRLLEHVRPKELLALTATPERSDGLPILHWFDERIAAELRLWDAIDQHRLAPFAYFGIADQLDLREIPWTRNRGYDVEGLTQLITGDDMWARHVLKEFDERIGVGRARVLGFCVSVEHARYMARVFSEGGVKATAVWADTPADVRRQALADLAAGRVQVVFSVDLFNEGVDVPSVDALLMLRPTDSPVLFIQQLGRGLRKKPGKSLCTVLDFVGQHRKEFRYDRRFKALLGGSRESVRRQVAEGFPYLPAGCHMELDRVATERVLDSIKYAVPRRWPDRVAELRSLGAERPDITLGEFLEATGLELEDIYTGKRSWSDLLEESGVRSYTQGPYEAVFRRACGRLLHLDDSQRIATWRRWLTQDRAPKCDQLSALDQRLLRMLLVQMLDQVDDVPADWDAAADLLWSHASVRRELIELCDVLGPRITHLSNTVAGLPDVPLQVHARYTRVEILAACGVTSWSKLGSWREGVRYLSEIPVDLLVFTLDKTEGHFSPTTRYRDYAISRELIHWESQSMTRATSPTGQRYQEHESLSSWILLFARQTTAERAFYFLGPARYLSHVGELPMAVTWKLDQPMPGDLFQAFAAAVA